jgi:hypothetical protein
MLERSELFYFLGRILDLSSIVCYNIVYIE